MTVWRDSAGRIARLAALVLALLVGALVVSITRYENAINRLSSVARAAGRERGINQLLGGASAPASS